MLFCNNAAHYHDVCPPSTIRLFAVMKLLAALIKNSAAPLNSRVSARPTNMFSRSHSSFNQGTSLKFLRTMGVKMRPGDIKLTRIPPVSSC